MHAHKWRGDPARMLGYREAIRERLPDAGHGLVALDLDLVLRCYGAPYGTDADGRVRLVEVKSAIGELTGAQRRTFPLLDRMLRAVDPAGDRYAGFYVVTTPDEQWATCDTFHVLRLRDRARRDMTSDAFWQWLDFGRSAT